MSTQLRNSFLSFLAAAMVLIAALIATGHQPADAQTSLPGQQRQIRFIVADDDDETTPAPPSSIDAGIANELTLIQDFLRGDVDRALRFQKDIAKAAVPAQAGTIAFDSMTKSLKAQGYNDPNTLYFVFANMDTDPYECASHGNAGGVEFTVLWMTACDTAFPSASPHTFGYGIGRWILRSIFQSLGAVPACAPHEFRGGVNDSVRDVYDMGPNVPVYENLTVDFGRDDYYGHGRSDCLDIANSRLWIPKSQCSSGAWCAAAPVTTPTPTPTATPGPGSGKVASQSSTYGGVAVASRAIDGQVDGRWAIGSIASTNSELSPWWQVDLGESVTVDFVEIWNRVDCCSERLSDFYVMVSDRPFTSNNLSTLVVDPNVTSKRIRERPSPSLAVDFGGIKGRYVRVQLPGTGILSLAEVRLRDEITPSRKVATQSSTYGGVAAASLAIDGKTDGRWSSGSVASTNRESQPWWQLDMGLSTSVGDVVVWNRTDCCSERLSDFYVMVSNQPFRTNNLATLLADPNVTFKRIKSSQNPRTVVNFGGKTARYVRVQLNGTNYLSLAEVEVVAPGQPSLVASQSSTYGGTAVASKAIDGTTDGRWSAGSVASTTLEENPWWQVDLGGSQLVGKIEVWNRTDCCSQRLSDFYILTSSQPFKSDDLATLLADPNVNSVRVQKQPNPSYAYTFSGGKTATYVRIQLNGTGYLSLAEVTFEYLS